MPKLKSLGSPGRNLKSFFHDQAELRSDHPSGSTSRKNLASSRPPRAKADAAKRDLRTRSNRPKTASASEVMQQSERSGGKKKEVASTLSKEADAKVNPKVNPIIVDKDKQHGVIDSGKEVQSNVPLSDPTCCFTSDDEEMTHAPTRKAKRPFGEVNLDLKAGEHGSPEDQKRRNFGPPQLQKLQTLHTMQEKEKEPCLDAARLRASVEADPANDSDLKEKACQNTKGNKSKQLFADQQVADDQNETSKQAQIKSGYGVITLFDGVSSVVPTLTKKFGYALAVAILAENDIEVRAVVCAEFGYRADEQWSFTPQGTAALYVKDVHSLIANNCQVLRSTIEAYPGLKWIITGGSPCQDVTFAGPYKGLLG